MGRGRSGRRGGGKSGARRDYDRWLATQRAINEDSSGWTPRIVGTTDDDTTVTFREGLGENEGHTLIADGTPSGRAFDRRGEHNHYGDNREGEGRVEDGGGDRGYYTGPDH